MPDRIGPSFRSELVAAHVSLEGLVWDAGEAVIVSAMDGDHHARATAVLLMHDPNKPAPVEILDRSAVVLNMHGLGVLKAFIACNCKATDLERWQAMTSVRIDNPVMLRIMAAATPPIDPVAVFNFTG